MSVMDSTPQPMKPSADGPHPSTLALDRYAVAQALGDEAMLSNMAELSAHASHCERCAAHLRCVQPAGFTPAWVRDLADAPHKSPRRAMRSRTQGWFSMAALGITGLAAIAFWALPQQGAWQQLVGAFAGERSVNESGAGTNLAQDKGEAVPQGREAEGHSRQEGNGSHEASGVGRPYIGSKGDASPSAGRPKLAVYRKRGNVVVQIHPREGQVRSDDSVQLRVDPGKFSHVTVAVLVNNTSRAQEAGQDSRQKDGQGAGQHAAEAAANRVPPETGRERSRGASAIQRLYDAPIARDQLLPQAWTIDGSGNDEVFDVVLSEEKLSDSVLLRVLTDHASAGAGKRDTTQASADERDLMQGQATQGQAYGHPYWAMRVVLNKKNIGTSGKGTSDKGRP